MARYQIRRPSPLKAIPTRVRRQGPAASSAPAAGEEKEESPESTYSPMSSPSTVDDSSDDDSDSEDEEGPPSPVKAGTNTIAGVPTPAPIGTPASKTSLAGGYYSTANATSVLLMVPVSSVTARISSQISQQPWSTQSPTSRVNNAAAPQSTSTRTMTTTTRPNANSTSITQVTSSPPARTRDIVTTSTVVVIPPAQSDTLGAADGPQMSMPHREAATMSKTAVVAASVLGVLGALALIIGVVILLKQRKRKQRLEKQRVADNAFNPDNNGSLRAPETAHFDDPAISSRAGDAGGAHMTQSTERSNTLFGTGSYVRPETVEKEQERSRFPIPAPIPTPNPFADPPLNKAYDVLAGRPRSTTLTDRGSWVKNPFHDPDSVRFDPFGELKEKARKERVRHMEAQRREHLEVQRREHLETQRREREKEVVRGFEEKERMGLVPAGLAVRRGSGVTLEGVGVLDRSGAGSYR